MIISVLAIIGYSFVVFAAAPLGGYNPGGTLDPDCAPGDVDCIVALPASWSLTGNSGTDSGVTNFLGTTDAQDLVFKTNNFEQMRIKSNGLIGFGVTNPANEFHMSKTTTGGYDIQSDSYGQQGTFTINRSSGTFAAPTRPGSGAILGTIGYGAYDSGTFATTAKIIAAMDAATGAGDLPTALSFQTTPDGSATALERLRITNGGRLGLGTSNPSAFVQTINQITTGENAIFDRYGNTSGIQFRMAGGTLAAPTAIVSGNRIFRISGSGYNGSAFSNNRATIGAAATENWTTTANGTKLEFAVTTTGSNILQTKATINENGLGINNSFPSANSAFVVGSGESFRVDDTGNLATINSVNYIWPSSQATGSGQVLTNDGSGNLTWAPGGGSAVSLIGSTNGLVSNPTPGFTTETWLGYGAGAASASTSNTIFIGQSAGSGAVSAESAIFLGATAGSGAINAYGSNFIGGRSGFGATDANDSNFFGQSAGYQALRASYSNFLGIRAGDGATDAYASNFFGLRAGISATNASYSNFFGYQSGENATSANESNFFGYQAGRTAYNANSSNFMGQSAGQGATNASYSNFLGQYSGDNAINASSSNFFGRGAGSGALNANNSNFFGDYAGFTASNSNNSNFLGFHAGQESTNASNSNFLGSGAGRLAPNANNSNFMGENAGYMASNANNSVFIGKLTGHQALYSSKSIFIGDYAGSWSDTIYGSTKASNSIFIGEKSGSQSLDLTLDNTTNPDDFSILIGNNTSTGGFSNSIALGANATNTSTNQFMIGSTNRPINQTRFQGSVIGTQCTITTGTGIACTSDERLKTNIVDLDNTILDKLSNIRTVNYNLIGDTSNRYQVGFLAQNLEQYFPELVDTNSDGYKSVYYAQMTPILTKAIQEMNLKITDIGNMETPNTWRDSLIAWFGNAENGITDFFSKKVSTEELCVKDSAGQTCITRGQLDALLNGQGIQTPQPSNPDPVISPDSTSENTGDETVGGSDESIDIPSTDENNVDSSGDVVLTTE